MIQTLLSPPLFSFDHLARRVRNEIFAQPVPDRKFFPSLTGPPAGGRVKD